MRYSFIKLIVALSLCGAIIIGYGVWYSFIAAKSAAAADLENQITATIEAVSRVAAARAALAKMTADEAKVQEHFVPQTGVVAFIDNLESHGRSLGAAVGVLSVSTGGTTKEPTLVLALTIKGTFDAVMRTVGAIEYAPYALSISELLIGQDFEKNWLAELKLHVGSIPLVMTATSSKPKALNPATL